MSICLNMIVKNEAHIIEKTIRNILNKIKINYYVICDTGSTDDTPLIIEKVFNEFKIEGKIYHDIWKNFGHNRSLALNRVTNCDYIFIFDADDEIIGMPEIKSLTKDAYMLKFGNYERILLVKRGLKWKYYGVLHEYIGIENGSTFSQGVIMGDYHIVSGRTGFRNKNPSKYLNDAVILEDAYHEALKTNDNLYHRYAYYCANSYLDAGNKEKAIEWYLKTLTCQGWFDERYNSCLKLGELIEDPSKYYYYLQSYTHNPIRIEGIYQLIKHYCCEGNYDICWTYYKLIEKNYLDWYNGKIDLNTFLFAQTLDYTFYLPYYMIIVTEKLKKIKYGSVFFEIIFDHLTTGGEWWTKNLIYNYQFFKCNEIKFNLYCKKFNQIIEKPYSKTILIYTGFAKIPWNATYAENNALGGSEQAVINLARYFAKEYQVIVSGDVLEEECENVKYIHRFNLTNLINSTKFHTIIVSRYVSFFTIFPTYSAVKVILMAHDIYFLNNLINCNKTPEEIINEHEITNCVCLTEWHKQLFTKLYPKLKDKIVLINNGIVLNKYVKPKIINSFIYTSSSVRGLERLLELWPDIVTLFPDAQLNISSYEDFPQNDFDNRLNEIIKKWKNIKHHGKLNKIQLNNLMSISEYWLYPCCFEETSCITAMEMLNHSVICLYYPIAGLPDTLKDYGFKITHGNEIEILKNVKLNNLKSPNNYIKTCTWEKRSEEWLNLFKFKQVFYASVSFNIHLLDEYLIGRNFTNDRSSLDKYDEVIQIYENFDNLIDKRFIVSILNTEPLNLKLRLDNLLKIVNKFVNVYDYSPGNLSILKKHGIDGIYLEYPITVSETNTLKLINKQQKEYDFGIICSLGSQTNSVDQLEPPRRKKVVEHLLTEGFKVNIIQGWGKMRDIELGKCQTILNIHGEYPVGTPSMIFEHIRCDRLLAAGFEILSETIIEEIIEHPHLKFIDYQSFFEIHFKK